MEFVRDSPSNPQPQVYSVSDQGRYAQGKGTAPLQAGYTYGPQGYPQQAPGYPQQTPGYPQQPVGYPQQAGGYPPQGTPNVTYGGFVNPGPPPPVHGATAPTYYTHDEPPPGYTPDRFSEGGTSETPALEGWSGFTEKAVRQAFIRKVYGILMLQLTFTFGMVCVCYFVEPIKKFIQTHIWLYIPAYILFFVLYIVLACCPDVRRKYPTNLILLSLFTIAMTYMLCTITAFHNVKDVLIALGICASCCLAISVFSFWTKFDFTTWGGVLFVLVWVLFLFGIVAIFTRDDIVRTVYGALGALLFMAFLAFDTQMIMGGKKHQISAEEHIFASLQLYIDVVYIFMFILTAMGGGRR